jgi:hypothetical protein
MKRVRKKSAPVDRTGDVNVRVAKRFWPAVKACAKKQNKPCSWVVDQAIMAYLNLDDAGERAVLATGEIPIVVTPPVERVVRELTYEPIGGPNDQSAEPGRDRATRESVHVSPAHGGSAPVVRSDSNGGEGLRQDPARAHTAERGPDGSAPEAPGVRDDGERVDRAERPVVVKGVDTGVDPDLGF